VKWEQLEDTDSWEVTCGYPEDSGCLAVLEQQAHGLAFTGWFKAASSSYSCEHHHREWRAAQLAGGSLLLSEQSPL